jgi:hypothetical protein
MCLSALPKLVCWVCHSSLFDQPKPFRTNLSKPSLFSMESMLVLLLLMLHPTRFLLLMPN